MFRMTTLLRFEWRQRTRPPKCATVPVAVPACGDGEPNRRLLSGPRRDAGTRTNPRYLPPACMARTVLAAATLAAWRWGGRRLYHQPPPMLQPSLLAVATCSLPLKSVHMPISRALQLQLTEPCRAAQSTVHLLAAAGTRDCVRSLFAKGQPRPQYARPRRRCRSYSLSLSCTQGGGPRGRQQQARLQARPPPPPPPTTAYSGEANASPRSVPPDPRSPLSAV